MDRECFDQLSGYHSFKNNKLLQNITAAKPTHLREFSAVIFAFDFTWHNKINCTHKIIFNSLNPLALIQ
jgi:hypothetical protein